MKTTRIDRIDNIFSEMSNILKTAEEIRKGLDDTSEEMIGLVGGNEDYFKCAPVDAIEVWFWALSVYNKGKLINLFLDGKFNISKEAPYLTAEINSLDESELYNFQENLKEFIQTIAEGYTKLKDLKESVESLNEKIKEFAQDPANDIESANLGWKEKIQAPLNIKNNVEVTGRSIQKFNTVLEAITKAMDVITDFITRIENIIKGADEIAQKGIKEGKKIYEGSCWIPSKIYPYYHWQIKRRSKKRKRRFKSRLYIIKRSILFLN